MTAPNDVEYLAALEAGCLKLTTNSNHMESFWSGIAFLIGLAAGALLLVQSFIVLFFGIPFTFRLRRLGIMSGRGPIASYCVSLLLLPLIFAGACFGMLSWFPHNMTAYWVGASWAFVLGMFRCGANTTNIKEYIESNANDIDITELSKHFKGFSPSVHKSASAIQSDGDLANAEKVVYSFADFLADDEAARLLVGDEDDLPYPKQIIEESFRMLTEHYQSLKTLSPELFEEMYPDKIEVIETCWASLSHFRRIDPVDKPMLKRLSGRAPLDALAEKERAKAMFIIEKYSNVS